MSYVLYVRRVGRSTRPGRTDGRVADDGIFRSRRDGTGRDAMVDGDAATRSESPESVLKSSTVMDAPKKRIARPPKPDRTAFEAKISELTAITDAKQARITEIKALVNAKRERRKASSTANAPLLEKVKALNAIANEKIAQRDAIREELRASDEKRDQVRAKANAMRSTTKFLTDESIDKEIDRIESKLSHETMPLAEEKRLIEQIKSLNKNRDLAREYVEKQAIITAHDAARKGCLDRIRAKDAEINSIKAEQGKIRSKLNEVKSKDDAANADVPALNEEKSAAYEEIKATREQINKLRAEQKKIEDSYWAQEKLFRAQQKEIKQAQWEASQEERKAREEARKQWELENAPEPFEEEISACDALMTYLAQWDVSKKNEQSTAMTTSTEEVTKGVEGMKLVTRDAADDDMFSVSSGYNKKKNKRGGKNAASSATIQHSFDTLAYFAKIQVAVVAKATDVPSTLESIRVKKEEFLQKRKIKKERQAAGLPDEEDVAKEKDKKNKSKEETDGESGKGKKGGKKGGSNPLSVSLTVKDDVVEVCVTLSGEQKK